MSSLSSNVTIQELVLQISNDEQGYYSESESNSATGVRTH